MSYIGDKLKYFSDFDDYSATLTKKDMDDNLKTMCSSVGFYLDSDGKTIKSNSASNEMILDFGVDNSFTDIGISSLVLGVDNTVTVAGTVFGSNNNVKNGLVCGNNNKSDNSFFISGIGVESVFACYSTGVNYKNIQPFSSSSGVNDRMDYCSLFVEAPQSDKTTDDTQKDLPADIKLHLKSLNYIKLYGKAFADDYSTKWIFERTLIVRVDDGGTVTIDSDDNTDIVKDDSDWAFDIEKTDDTENPKLTFKVTGKADTNIFWNARCENDITYWNI